MAIFASEDIGNANPNALNIAASTLTAVSKIGYPEARIILGQCAIYLAHSPKSNAAYLGINAALKFVRSAAPLPTPRYLINSDKQIADYKYPHDFGGWVDMLIMRIVDIFYCIPSIPIYIIIGAAMDALHVDPQIRMIYLMMILGFFGWPSITRLVRGQILTLREQEFMTAAEATGIKPINRIFRHLLPNVIPQLIVTCTMSLGGVILTEATLSFLGLGVKFPFASWGNIINDVNNTYVLSNYLFIWIPAGICLLLTVLAFNLVGDGLRDAFDPKMKR